MIAQAAAESTDGLLTLVLSGTGLVPLGYVVYRHVRGRPLLVFRDGPVRRVPPVPFLLAMVGVFMVYGLCALLVVPPGTVAEGEAARGAGTLRLGTAGAVAGVLFPVLLVLVAGATLLRRAFRPRQSAPRRAGRGALVTWAALPLIYGLLYLLQRAGLEGEQDVVRRLVEREPGWAWLALFAVVAAPAAEELCFRGLLFPALRTLGGPVVGIVASGVLFGLIHSPFAVVVPLALLGIVLAALVETTGSLLPAVVGHALFNALTVGELILAG